MLPVLLSSFPSLPPPRPSSQSVRLSFTFLHFSSLPFTSLSFPSPSLYLPSPLLSLPS
jgi:hypothetical protein